MGKMLEIRWQGRIAMHGEAMERLARQYGPWARQRQHEPDDRDQETDAAVG